MAGLIFLKYLIHVLYFFQQTIAQWQIVFYISAGIGIFGGLVYIFFADCNEQSWNKTPIVCYTDEPATVQNSKNNEQTESVLCKETL